MIEIYQEWVTPSRLLNEKKLDRITILFIAGTVTFCGVVTHPKAKVTLRALNEEADLPVSSLAESL